MTLSIGGIEVGDANPCRFVAEVSCNHDGSLVRAFRLIDAAKAAKADWVKFQAYRPGEIVALRGDGPAPADWGKQGYRMSQLYDRAQTPLEWFPALAAYCEHISMPWFSSAFGAESLAVLVDNDCPAIKIAALDRAHADLVDAAIATGKPVLISCDARALSLAEVRRVPSARWLHCPPGYPATLRPGELGRFIDVDPVIGLSSHCLHPDLPIAAVARGCKLIEMHMMLAEEPSELESNVSLTQHQFAEMIRRVREVESFLG